MVLALAMGDFSLGLRPRHCGERGEGLPCRGYVAPSGVCFASLTLKQIA